MADEVCPPGSALGPLQPGPNGWQDREWSTRPAAAAQFDLYGGDIYAGFAAPRQVLQPTNRRGRACKQAELGGGGACQEEPHLHESLHSRPSNNGLADKLAQQDDRISDLEVRLGTHLQRQQQRQRQQRAAGS